MPHPSLCAAAAALIFALPVRAEGAVTKGQVEEAIRTFEADSLGNLTSPKPVNEANAAVARASNTILKFALESNDVVVDLGTDSVPWCDVKKGLSDLSNSGQRGLLFAAYVAGSVKAQLESGRQDANPLAGWVAMLRLYRAIRSREGIRIPEVEVLLAKQADGTLPAAAAAALARSTENLRKAYGSAGGPP